jgi:hypothetical protein
MSSSPTNTVWKRVQGDVDDTAVAILGGVADLAGVIAARARVTLTTADEPATPVALAASVTDPDACEVTVRLSPWLADAELGSWELEIETDWQSGQTLTFPEGRKPMIFVVPQLG